MALKANVKNECAAHVSGTKWGAAGQATGDSVDEVLVSSAVADAGSNFDARARAAASRAQAVFSSFHRLATIQSEVAPASKDRGREEAAANTTHTAAAGMSRNTWNAELMLR